MATGPRKAKRRGDPAAEAFRLRHSPFFLLSRLSNRYVLDMEAVLKTIQMDIPRWRTLMIVREREPSSVSEIAELACIRLSTMTRVVQRLVRQGLARVDRRALDGRKTDVYLTAAGRRACEDVRRIASRVYARAFADFGDDDVRRLCELLGRAHANLEAGDLARALPARRARAPRRAVRRP
ncbi:MAG: MarR family transcriptional regulator [Steroidobacteraceae bacterium]|jgi:DNA-binding MarR family transcriptional regulator|nr:MarR family transcriptional regulator [Steroidobacteraceae bacterium]